MNTTLKFGLAAVVVAVAALIGLNYLPASNVGGPGFTEPTSPPTPEPTPTAEPSVAEPSPTSEGFLPEGSHVLRGEPVPITVTIPAPDWYREPGGGILLKNASADAPDGAGMIVFPGDGELFVYGDPCQWSTTKPDTPATTVDELVAALTAQPSRDTTAPVDVTVDGHAGKSITLHVPDDAVFSDCARGEFRTLVEGPDGARYHQDPGQIDKLWILDVDGQPMVFDIAYYEGTPQEVVDEMEAIVASITFGE